MTETEYIAMEYYKLLKSKKMTTEEKLKALKHKEFLLNLYLIGIEAWMGKKSEQKMTGICMVGEKLVKLKMVTEAQNNDFIEQLKLRAARKKILFDPNNYWWERGKKKPRIECLKARLIEIKSLLERTKEQIHSEKRIKMMKRIDKFSTVISSFGEKDSIPASIFTKEDVSILKNWTEKERCCTSRRKEYNSWIFKYLK